MMQAGINVFSFVKANPLNKIDRTGLQETPSLSELVRQALKVTGVEKIIEERISEFQIEEVFKRANEEAISSVKEAEIAAREKYGAGQSSQSQHLPPQRSLMRRMGEWTVSKYLRWILGTKSGALEPSKETASMPTEEARTIGEKNRRRRGSPPGTGSKGFVTGEIALGMAGVLLMVLYVSTGKTTKEKIQRGTEVGITATAWRLFAKVVGPKLAGPLGFFVGESIGVVSHEWQRWEDRKSMHRSAERLPRMTGIKPHPAAPYPR